MKCNYIEQHTADLFDDSLTEKQKAELFAHINVCPECATEYKRILQTADLLKPKINIKASVSFSENLMQKLNAAENQKPKIRKMWELTFENLNKYRAVAASFLVILSVSGLLGYMFLFNKPLSAQNVLDQSILAFKKIESVYMILNVRTNENDNFELIELENDFCEYKISSVFGNSPKWKAEKKSRVFMYDSINSYLFIPQLGYAGKYNGFINALSWMNLFTNPQKILETEKDLCKNKNFKYEIKEMGEEIELTVFATAQGDFTNPYLLNSSVEYSNNKRVYIFDAKNYRLKTMSLFVQTNNTEILAVELKQIVYNYKFSENHFEIPLPQGVSWVNADTGFEKGIKNKSARETAVLFFNACEQNNWDTVLLLFPILRKSYKFSDFKKMYGNLKLIKTGESFTSGQYPGEFVPYTIQLSNGDIKSYNLALRKDNINGFWEVDGGF